MSNFTNVFGGSAISPSDVAYAAYSFSANLTLYWPAFSAGQSNVAARFMNLTATAGSLNVYMPDATQISVGYDVLIFNAGTNTFNVVDYSGGAIATIAAGQTYNILNIGNTTQAGTWQTTQFGVGTGAASAAALAGAGLLAAAGLLEVNTPPTVISSSYSITAAARGTVQAWAGGAGTITLPTAASVGSGFIFALTNNGSGSVTVATSGEQIDGASTSVFVQTQSSYIISSGTAWYTIGKGIQNTFAVTLLNLNVAGSSDVTETSAQAQNIIQQFTGTLTGNINVIVPNTVQLYYLYNNTSGSYTLTFKTAAGSGVVINQGSHTIVYCDGTNVVPGYTASFGGAISLSPGTANAPNLNFIGSGSTGIYSPTTNQIAFTAGGFEVMNFISQASSVNYLQASASATGTAVSISALGNDTNIGITLTAKGTGSINIAKAAITGGTVDATIIGGTTPAAITGTNITVNTSFVLKGSVSGTTTLNSGATAGTSVLTLPVATDTLVGRNTTDTLTNKTFTSPILGAASATSITFPSGGNTAFNWYEEGTFTPTFYGDSTAGSPTYTSQQGSFTRIGRQVSYTLRIGISAIGGMTGGLRIAGLPYAVNGRVGGAYHNETDNVAANIYVFASFCQPSTSEIYLYKQVSGGTTKFTAADITATTQLFITGFYYA